MHSIGSRFRVSAIALTTVLLVVAAAQAQTVNPCSSKKKICVAKKAAGLLKCHERAEKTGAPVESLCTQKVVDKFTTCFAKLEANGGCLTIDDTDALEAKVDAFVLDVVTEVDPAYPAPISNPCSARKKKCVGKKAKALLKCHAKAEKTGVLDTTCVQKAKDKFDGGPVPAKGCFARLEAKGGCPTIGDTTPLEAKVDAFVDDVVCELDPATCPAPTPVPTSTPGGPCPSTYQFTATGPAVDRDLGFTGQAHDVPMTTNVRLTLAISGCANAVTPCGQCTVSGPIANGGGPGLNNHRCRGDQSNLNGSWMTCASNADCPGTGNACVYFLGPPQPIAFGGVSVCDLTEIENPVSGTLNSDTGAMSAPLTLRNRIFTGPLLDSPCPRCVSGMCDAGPRSGQACTPSGSSALFSDDVSFDCPPSVGSSLSHGGVLLSTVLSTGTQMLTLSAASPNCTAVGFTSSKCFCQTCDNLAATPCLSNADCTAVGATVCGGKRCLAGSNAGAPCSAASECPGSPCAVPGAPTKPNECNDATCTPNTPPDNDSVNEGRCAAGPIEHYCVLEPFRGCIDNADCFNVPGDTCGPDQYRECFTDNGVSGNSIVVAGVASTTAPTVGALYCMPPTAAASVNFAMGLPGAARATIPGTAVIN